MERDRELQEDERDLPVGAAALEQREQRPVVPDRGVQRPFEAGAVAGPRQVEHRLVLRVPGERMVREQAEHLVAVLGVPLLEPAHRLAVELLAVGGEQRPVRGLLDQRVLEPVLGLGPAASLADQVDALELRSATPGATRRRPSRPRAAAVRTAGRGRTPPSGRRDRRAASRSIRARITFSTVGGITISASWSKRQPSSFANEHARLGERADELLEVERVALGSFQDLLFEVRRKRALAEQRDEELAVGVARQGPERELADRCGYCAAAIVFTRHDGWSRLRRLLDDDAGRPRCR